MATVTAPLTVAEFEALNLPPDKRFELVGGQVVELAVAYLPHDDVKMNIDREFLLFDPQRKLGRVYCETMCQLSSNDLRVPDVSFFLNEQLPPPGLKSYLPAPALAVEVVSSERASDALLKMKDYFRAGTRTVWMVYPESRTVMVHEADGSARMLEPPRMITISWLPGFEVPVAAFFDRL